ncbi:MAG: hypothetical protein ACJ73E_08525 [Mycobacteriales bacterium]
MIYTTLDSFRCHEETDEVGSDEPYVIVVSVDLRNTTQVTTTTPGGPASGAVTVPASRAYLYGPFGDVDGQENHIVPFQSFWGLAGEERALDNPDDAVFLVGLMENDDGNPENLRGIVGSSISAALAATLGFSRPQLVDRLLREMNSALSTVTGFPNTDDRVGFPVELRFTPADVALAETGNPARQVLRVQGDGGDYSLVFVARNRGQAAWRFCGRCNSMFFDGRREKGACPAGGAHAANGFVFYLPHEHAGPLGGQPDWRFCDRCFAMYFAPIGTGRCPAGGHSFNPGSFNFFLPHDHGGPGQDQWRFCDLCHVLFFDGFGNKGVCTAAGAAGHHAQGFNFKLDFTP